MVVPIGAALFLTGRVALQYGGRAITAAARTLRSGSGAALKGTKEVGAELAKREPGSFGNRFARMAVTGAVTAEGARLAEHFTGGALSSALAHSATFIADHHPDISREQMLDFASGLTDYMNTGEEAAVNFGATVLEDYDQNEIAVITRLGGAIAANKTEFALKLAQQDEGERAEFAADYIVEKSGVSRDELVEMLESKPGNREMLENMLDSGGIDLNGQDIFPELTQLQNIPGYNKDKLKNHFESARNSAEGFSLTSAFQSSAWDGFAETMDHIWDVLRNLIGMVFLGGIAKIAHGLTGGNILQDAFQQSADNSSDNKDPEPNTLASETEQDGPTNQPPAPGAPGMSS